VAISNAVLATTLPLLIKKVLDNSFLATPLFRALQDAGALKRKIGSQRIEQPVMFGTSTNMTEITGSGFNALDMSVQDPFNRAIFEWSLFTKPLLISDQWALSNAGDEEISNILENLVSNALIDMRKQISSRVFTGAIPTSASATSLQTLNGSGTSALAADTTGWLQAVAFGSQTTNTVGGLSKSTYAALNWQNQYVNAGGTLSLADIDELMIQASLYHPGGRRPDILFMSPKCFAAFQGLLTDDYRYQNVSDRDALAGANYVATWRGAKVYVEPTLGFTSAAAGTPVISAYAVSSDMVNMYIDPNADFSVGELAPYPGYAARFANITLRTQLVTGHLASAGILANAEA
jgi:hypothetical protein